MKTHYIVSLVLVFASVVTNANDVEPKIEFGKEQVRDLLKDPVSAQFKGVTTVINSKGSESICGEVNARNSYGGYVGFQKFVVLDGVATIVNPDEKKTVSAFNLGGCDGEMPELLERLHLEATFNCNVIWTMLENVVVNKQTTDQAVKAAMHATSARAENNQSTISEESMRLFEKQYRDTVRQTLSDKRFLKSVKRKSSRYSTRAVWLASCISQTNLVLQSQIE